MGRFQGKYKLVSRYSTINRIDGPAGPATGFKSKKHLVFPGFGHRKKNQLILKAQELSLCSWPKDNNRKHLPEKWIYPIGRQR
jgi:hypothetical protein